MPYYTPYEKNTIASRLSRFLKSDYNPEQFAESILSDYCYDSDTYELSTHHTGRDEPVLIEIARLASLPELYEYMAKNAYPADEAIFAINEQREYLGV